jgi:hypothetical protein
MDYITALFKQTQNKQEINKVDDESKLTELVECNKKVDYVSEPKIPSNNIISDDISDFLIHETYGQITHDVLCSIVDNCKKQTSDVNVEKLTEKIKDAIVHGIKATVFHKFMRMIIDVRIGPVENKLDLKVNKLSETSIRIGKNGNRQNGTLLIFTVNNVFMSEIVQNIISKNICVVHMIKKKDPNEIFWYGDETKYTLLHLTYQKILQGGDTIIKLLETEENITYVKKELLDIQNCLIDRAMIGLQWYEVESKYAEFIYSYIEQYNLFKVKYELKDSNTLSFSWNKQK